MSRRAQQRPGIPLLEEFIAVAVAIVVGAVAGLIMLLVNLCLVPFRGRTRKAKRDSAEVTIPAREVVTKTGEQQSEAPEESHPQSQEGLDDHPLPEVEAQDIPPDVVEPQGKATGTTKHAGPAMKYVGFLRWSGMKTRKDVPDPYVSYCVKLYDTNLKADVEVWGKGLRTAIEASTAEKGDLIKIENVGQQQVLVGEQSFRKNIWTAEVIKRGKRQAASATA